MWPFYNQQLTALDKPRWSFSLAHLAINELNLIGEQNVILILPACSQTNVITRTGKEISLKTPLNVKDKTTKVYKAR